MKKCLFILVLFLSQFVSSQKNDYPDGEVVSIINLIANPQNYYDKKITVMGYLSLDFEFESVYLNENDASNGVFTNGIGIYGLNREINKKYVILSGTFKKNVVVNERMISSNFFKGYILDITFVMSLDEWRRW